MNVTLNRKGFIAAIKYCFGISVFLYVVVKIDYKHLDFSSIDMVYVALSILPLIFFIVFQGVRFNNLLTSPLKLVELTLLQFKLQFFNLILPGGIGGDAYRVLVLKHAEKSLGVITSKSVVDRLSGMLVTSTLFVWSLPSVLTVELKNEMMLASWLLGIGSFVASAVVLSRYWLGWELLAKSMSLLFFSFCCWVAQVCRLWLICVAIGLNFSVRDMSFLLGILQMASLLPITVGGLGVVEGAFMFAAGLLGAASPVGALGAVLMRITTVISGLFGFSIWLRGKLS